MATCKAISMVCRIARVASGDFLQSVEETCDAIIKDFCCNHKKIGIFFKSGRPRRARSRPKEPSKQACVSRTARFCVSRGRRWGGGAAVCADVRDFRKWAENRSLAGPLSARHHGPAAQIMIKTYLGISFSDAEGKTRYLHRHCRLSKKSGYWIAKAKESCSPACLRLSWD